MKQNGRQPHAAADDVRAVIAANTAVAGVVGLGYVGLPLAVELARSGFRTMGFDVNSAVVDGIRLSFPTLALMAKTEERQELWGGETSTASMPATVMSWTCRPMC